MALGEVDQARLAQLEEDIVRLQEQIEFWNQSGIPRRTIVILLSHYTKVPQKTIKLILEGMEALYETYFEEEE